MSYTWIVLWIALVPFVLLYAVFEGAKVWWVWMGGLILALQWFLTEKSRARLSAAGSWFIGWIAALSLASVWGVHPLESFVGGGYRHQGVIFFLTMFLVGDAVGRLSLGWKEHLLSLVGWGAVAQSVLVIIQKLWYGFDRPWGTFGEPNAAAGYLALGLYWIWVMPMREKRIRFILSGIVFFAIFATQSRSGILAAAVVAAGLGWKHTRMFFYGLVVLAVAGGSIALVSVSRPPSPYENRPLFWTMAAKAIVNRPILGYGVESGEFVFNELFARENIRLFDFVVERSHNIFLDVAMWSGIVGLAVFLRWLWEVVVSIRRRGDVVQLWVLAAWLVFASVQPVGVVHWVHLMLLISARDNRFSDNRPPDDRCR